jgi:hypothetical protein
MKKKNFLLHICGKRLKKTNISIDLKISRANKELNGHIVRHCTPPS